MEGRKIPTFHFFFFLSQRQSQNSWNSCVCFDKPDVAKLSRLSRDHVSLFFFFYFLQRSPYKERSTLMNRWKMLLMEWRRWRTWCRSLRMTVRNFWMPLRRPRSKKRFLVTLLCHIKADLCFFSCENKTTYTYTYIEEDVKQCIGAWKGHNTFKWKHMQISKNTNICLKV